MQRYSTPPSGTVGTVAEEEEALLLAELQPLRLSALKKRARDKGVAEDCLEECEFDDDPRARITDLILSAELLGHTSGAITNPPIAEEELKAHPETARHEDEIQLTDEATQDIQTEREARVDNENEVRAQVSVEATAKAEAEASRNVESITRAEAEEEAETKAAKEMARTIETAAHEASAKAELQLEAEEAARVKSEEDAKIQAAQQVTLIAVEDSREKAEEEFRANVLATELNVEALTKSSAEDEQEDARVQAHEDAKEQTEQKVTFEADGEQRMGAENEEPQASSLLKAVEDSQANSNEERGGGGRPVARPGTSVWHPSARSLNNDQEHVFHMHIPTNFIGTIIGKGGQNIKQIGQISGCKCFFSNQDCVNRRAVVIGTYSQAVSALTIIWEQMQVAANDASEEPQTNAEVVIFIRDEAAGLVLGKQGKVIHSIRESSQTAIAMNNECEEGLRPVTITGQLPSVLHAIELIVDIAKGAGVFPRGSRAGTLARLPCMRALDSLTERHAIHPRALESNTEYLLHMLIPSKFIGAVLGKGGSAIKHTGRSSGCKCCITNKDNDTRHAVISGTYNNAVSAATIIWEQVQVAANEAGERLHIDATIVIHIRDQAAGRILGSQGKTIRSIRDWTQTNITMNRESEGGLRPVTTTGRLQSVLQAIGEIVAIVEGGSKREFAPSMTAAAEPSKKMRRVQAHS